MLTIAGSDSSGGAGIQADLRTFGDLGVHGMSVVTAITAQNTTTVQGVMLLPPQFIALQLNTVLRDMAVDAIKIGMLGHQDAMGAVEENLDLVKTVPVIFDPVLRASTGTSLFEGTEIERLRRFMVGYVTLITPNIMEAEVLTGLTIHTEDDMHQAARSIHEWGVPFVLVKGGHMVGPHARDVLVFQNGVRWYEAPRIMRDVDVRGTGCTYASAIASFVARGLAVVDAIDKAKEYLTQRIQSAVVIGQGARVIAPARSVTKWEA